MNFSAPVHAASPSAPPRADAQMGCEKQARASTPPTHTPSQQDSFHGPRPRDQAQAPAGSLKHRLEMMRPELIAGVQRALLDQVGWEVALDDIVIETTNRAGVRAALCTHERHNAIIAYLLSWLRPVMYDADPPRVLIVTSVARHYSDDTLRYQLASAMCEAVIRRKNRDFDDDVALRKTCEANFSYDVYACLAWAQALGHCIAQRVAPAGHRAPWWQRLGLFCLRPFASYTVGPMRLARSFVPLLPHIEAAKKGLVGRMVQFPQLCSVLYGPAGLRDMQALYTPDYKEDDFAADIEVLRQFSITKDATPQ